MFVYTLDVITPIVDDPRSFGRIAAANSLSDVYAMGAVPAVALSFAGIPGELGLDVFREVIHGAAEKAAEAGCAVVGGHTIKDTEPKCGLAVIGHLKEAAWTHERAKAGQALVLTKKLGTGILAQAQKKGEQAKHVNDDFRIAQASMETLNDKAATFGRKHGASAATDVTGFGFLGHLWHMCSGSDLRARIDVEQVPFFETTEQLANAGLIPGGSKKNWRYVEDKVQDLKGCSDARRFMLADAQTSGGLLLAMPKENVDAFIADLPGSVLVGGFEAKDNDFDIILQ